MNWDPQALFAGMKATAAAMVGIFGMLGVLTGLFYFLRAAQRMIKPDPRDEGPNFVAVATNALIGALLMQFSTSLDWARELTGGAGSGVRSAMQLSGSGGGSSFWSLVLAACFAWVAALGVLAVYRGFLLFNRSGSGENPGSRGDDAWAAIWHIIGGCICINMGT